MSFSSVVSGLSPTAWWRLGDTSGSTMTDSSGNSHSGTYTSVTLNQTSLVATDLTDKATLFNGTTSRGVVTYGSWADASTALSVHVVGKFTSTSTMALINRDSDSNRLYQFRVNGGKLEFVTIGGTVGVVTAQSTSTYNDGNAHYFGATFDGSNIRLYVDGVKVKTQAASGNLGTAGQDIAVGYRPATGSNIPFDGTLDEAMYWAGTVLTDANFTSIYNAGTTAGGSTGTASLSLSASGTAAGPGTGTAALSLAASGTGGTAGTGTAALSLSASGSAKAPLVATAALSLAASGSTGAPATGNASITLTATGDASEGSIPGDGTASLSLNASGSGGAATTGLAAITLGASGTAGGQVVGIAALSLSASATAKAILTGQASISLQATGLVRASGVGSAYIVLTASAPTVHAPYRDVDVLAIVDVSRLVQFADDSRTVTIQDVARLVSAALADGTKKMNLRSQAREFYALTIDTEPQISAWQASFDDKATWFDGELVDGTDNKFRWLVRGPDFDATGQVVATSAPLPLGTVKPIIRATDDPENIWRSSADKVPTIKVAPAAG